MHESRSFLFPYAPIPLARPRLAKNGHVYDSQYKEKAIWIWDARSQSKGLSPLKGVLKLDVEFTMPIANSLSKVKKCALDKTYHCIKPDLSNLLKFVEDVLIGIAYIDDSQISVISTCKIYGTKPQSHVTISQISSPVG